MSGMPMWCFQPLGVIPVQVNADKAEATFEDGVLTLTIPKAEAVKPKQIKIKAESNATKGKK